LGTGLLLGLSGGLIGSLVNGFIVGEIGTQAFPNQGIKRSMQNAVIRTSDSLLKMDIRAAHEWSRLKAACL
jgi:hypothetical protein